MGILLVPSWWINVKKKCDKDEERKKKRKKDIALKNLAGPLDILIFGPENLCGSKTFKVQPQGKVTFSAVHGVEVTLQFLGFSESDSEHNVWPLFHKESACCCTQTAHRQWCLGWDMVRDQYSRDSLLTASIIHKYIHGWPIRHVHTCVHAHTHTNTQIRPKWRHVESAAWIYLIQILNISGL